MNKDLLYERKNGFEGISEKEKALVFEFCDEYSEAITKAKTEREFSDLTVAMLEKAGFKNVLEQTELKSGDKVYCVNRGKGIAAFVIGKKPVENGVNIVGAHIDSPRLDLKQNPLYEDNGIAYLKTHYYGGIRKYQWFSIPLSLHGVIVKTDGTQISVNIGEDEKDPVFTVADLLPHLGQAQAEKKLAVAFEAEKMNVIVGNMPCDDADKEKVKYGVMKLLNEKYGIVEKDFITAELELVPAFPARDLGLDRSMIGAYGHDDRVCAYTALRAIIDTKNPEKTAACLLVDKEEIGSVGNTGMKSRFFENCLAKLCLLCNGNYNDIMLRECLSNSACLSADVGAAYDGNYAEVYEKNNSCFINGGLLLTKYTGARGKSGASDANAEFVAKVCEIMDKAKVLWQCGELGKTDAGGGGTIAGYVANLDIEVIDAGVPLLAMHSPFEVAGKYDVYMAYKGYNAFMNS